MIRFLKLNDPFRLVVIFLFLLAIRLPFWLGEIPLLSPELTWMLMGEKMNEGLLLYRDFDVTMAPLSAFVYQFIDFVIGRSPMTYQILAFVLVYFQSILFNWQINRMMVLPEKTYLPAFIYGVSATFFFDCYTLSPILLSLTFFIFALGELFYAIKEGSTQENSFYIGFFLGMTILFFVPMVLLIIVFFLGNLLYTNMYIKGYFILFFGLAFPFLILFTFYYWNDGFEGVLTNLFYYSFYQSDNFISLNEILKIITLPAILLTIAILRVLNSTVFINYQMRIQSVMLFCIIAGVFIIILVPQLAMYHFLVFLPPFVLFMSAFFLIMTKKLIRETVFYLYLIFFIYAGYSHDNSFTSYLKLKNLVVQKNLLPAYGKILVLGPQKENYQNNKVATTYIDWHLSQQYFLDLDNYENISQIYTAFKKDFPAIVIDNEGVMGNLLDRIPEFKNLYKQEGNLYRLKK